MKPKAAPRTKKSPCPSFEEVLKDAKWAFENNCIKHEKNWYVSLYKDGGKQFDLALEFLNSPLHQELA